MPEKEDLDRIEEMLRELGETELELGEIREQEYMAQLRKEEGAPAAPEAEGALGIEGAIGIEEAIGAEGAEEALPVEGEDFQELLKDIEIGLTEERELEERIAAEEAAPPPEEELAIPEPEGFVPEEEAVQPEPEIPAFPEEVQLPEAEIPAVEEGMPAVEGEEEPEEAFIPIEELLGEEVSAPPEEEPSVQMPEPGEPVEGEEMRLEEEAEAPEEEGMVDEEALDLPIDFDIADLRPAEGPPGAPEAVEEEVGEKAPEEVSAVPETGEVPEAIEPEEITAPEVPEGESITAEEPSIELEDIMFEEIEEPEAPAEEGAPEEVPVSPPEMAEEAGVPSEIEEDLEAILGIEAISEEEMPPEPEAAVPPEFEGVEEAEEEIPLPEGIELEEEPEKPVEEAIAEGEVAEAIEGISFEDLEAIGLKEEVPEEFAPIEEIGPEEFEAGEEAPTSEVGVIEEPAPELVEELERYAGPEMPEVPEIEEEEAAVTGGEIMELTEDDIGQIKTKLSTMNPVVAATVQEIIVKGALPADSMNGIVELLILDAPEQEIVEYVERVTGRKIVVPRIRRPLPVAVRKPGVLGVLAENLGPFVRAALLFGAVFVVLAALFFVFFYNPIRAWQHYRTSVERIQEDAIQDAKDSFVEARKYHDRMPQFYRGVRQHDRFGWQLMLQHDFEAAQEVLEEGAKKEIDKNGRIRNLRLFMRLAILHNVEGSYEDIDGSFNEAETLYAWVLNDLGGEEKGYPAFIEDTKLFQSSRREKYERARRIAERVSMNSAERYDFHMLRGENLIALAGEYGVYDSDKKEEAFTKAQVQFQKAANLDKREAAPLYKQLQIEILRNDPERVNNLTSDILRRFPKSVDEEVQTELARYFIGKESFSLVRDLLLSALHKRSRVYPYPPAYAAYGTYYKVVGNTALQEEYLLAAIEAENSRVLPHPWNYRDRMLVSWTDDAAPRIAFRKSDRAEAAEIQADNTQLLFPWDKTNIALISQAYNDLGEIYAQGESEETVAQAIIYFKSAIVPRDGEGRPLVTSGITFNPKANFNLAQVYFYHVKDYDNALKHYGIFYNEIQRGRLEKSEYAPLINDLYYNLGYLYYNYKKDWTRALSYWSKLDPVLPDNPHVQMAIANTMLHRGAYESALGRYIYLSEIYDQLIDELGEIKPWRNDHKRILGESAAVYNNLGVAYQKLNEQKRIDNYQRNSLVALYKAGEYADILGEDRGIVQYNIHYIIHPEIVRSDMKINDYLSDNYRFNVH